MNNYTLDDINIGQIESFPAKITSEMMNAFRLLTGDENLLHTDDAFAREKGFSGRVAYGMLTASFLSTLVGVYLAGRRSLIHKVEVEFPAPVMPDDELTVSGEVMEKDVRFNLLKLAVTIRNAKGQKVCRGKMTVGVLIDK